MQYWIKAEVIFRDSFVKRNNATFFHSTVLEKSMVEINAREDRLYHNQTNAKPSDFSIDLSSEYFVKACWKQWTTQGTPGRRKKTSFTAQQSNKPLN